MRTPKLQKEYDEYKKTLNGECNFCMIGKGNKIILVSTYWIVMENKFPWGTTKEQLLVLPKRHIPQDKPDQVTIEEAVDLMKIREDYRDYTILHNGIDGSSIGHLHYQLLIWKK